MPKKTSPWCDSLGAGYAGTMGGPCVPAYNVSSEPECLLRRLGLRLNLRDTGVMECNRWTYDMLIGTASFAPQ